MYAPTFNPVTMSTTTVQTQKIQPDIKYYSDFSNYQLRTERLKAQRPSRVNLPPGFPQKLEGHAVWEGKDFTDNKQQTLFLDEDNLKEIHQAFLTFKGEYQSPKT
jgi:hypothetical protein